MRLALLATLAVLVNALLFAWLQALSSPRQARLDQTPAIPLIAFVPEAPRPPPPPRREPPPPPPKPRPPPPRPRLAQTTVKTPAPRAMRLPLPDLRLAGPLDLGEGPYLGPVVPEAPALTDAPLRVEDLTLVAGLPPQYPPSARMRHTEGYVDVELVVDEKGRVQSPRIVRADPPRVFDRAVLRAVRSWRFEPRLKNGEPVKVRVRQHLTFRLNDR